MRTKVLLLCIALITSMLIASMLHVFPNAAPPTNENTDAPLTAENIVGGTMGLFAHHPSVPNGDFERYFYVSGSFSALENIYSNFHAGVQALWTWYPAYLMAGNFSADYTPISTNLLRTYKIQVQYTSSSSWYSPYATNLLLQFNYADNNHTHILNIQAPLFGGMFGSYDSGSTWINGTFPAGKTLVSMTGSLMIQGSAWSNVYLDLWITQEYYYGIMPTIANWIVPPLTTDLETPFLFSAQAYNTTAVYLASTYVPSSASISVPLSNYGYPSNNYSAFYAFPTTGLYALAYVAYNTWGVYTITPSFVTYAYHFPYPQSSKLTIHCYEYRAIPTDMFYVYLGVNERVCLFDFRTVGKFGSWQYMGPGSLTQWFGYQSLNFITNQSGVKSALSTAYYFNLTLQFDLKTNATALLILINPTHGDYDYLLNTTGIAQSKDWITVRIPWYMFQKFAGASNVISELGFFGLGYYTIANVFLARYSAAQPLLSSPITYQTNETTTFSYQKQDFLGSSALINKTFVAANGYYQAFNYDNKAQYGTYTNTRIFDSVLWVMQTNKAATPPYPFTFSYLEFNMSGVFADIFTCKFVGEASIPTSGKTGNISIFNWVSGLYDLLWDGIANTIATRYKVLNNAMNYINSTGFCKVRGYSGYGFSGGIWQSNFACDYFGITASFPPTLNNTIMVQFPAKTSTSAVYLTLTVTNTSLWKLYLYYVPTKTWVPYYSANYSALYIASTCYNNSLFLFKLQLLTPGLLSFAYNVTAFLGTTYASRTLFFTPPSKPNEVSVWYNFSNPFALLQISGYYGGSWHILATINSTTRFWQFWMNTSAFTLTQLRFFFVLYSNSWSALLQLQRLDFVIYSSYRLACMANRQASDQLVFTQATETLLLVDFAGRIIYEREVSAGPFIDIYLNIAEFILVNNAKYPIWFAFSAWGFSITAYLVPAGTWRIVNLLMDDYMIRILNAHNQILEIRIVSVSQSNYTQGGGWNITYPLEPPTGDILTVLWEAICAIWGWLTSGDPWTLVVWIPLGIYILYQIIKFLKYRHSKEIKAFVAGQEYAQQSNKRPLSKQDILEAIKRRNNNTLML